MVKAYYTPADKRLPATLSQLQSSLRDIQAPTGTEKERSLLKLQEQQLVLSDQVAELQGRASHQVSVAELNLVYGTGWGEKGPVTRNFTLPGPGASRRTALLVGSGLFAWSGGTAAAALGIYLRLELWQGSTMLGADVANVSNNPFIPAAFNGDSASFVASVQIPAVTSQVFQLRLSGYRSADGGTVTDAGKVTNISFNIQYGDKY